MSRAHGICISAFLVALAAVAGWSQVQSRLGGTVTDTTGAVVAGAALSATRLETRTVYKAASQATGIYSFPFLPPGSYELTCEVPGFQRFARPGLVLETGLSRTVDIELKVGDVRETVTVQATTPLLESDNSTVGQFIERTTVFNMPVNTRTSAPLVRLAGNVTYTSGPIFSLGGGRTYNQMWYLDGGVVQNVTMGITQLVVNPPIEALQEFKVETSNYAAEFGRTAGGLILMTTRSGTNAHHGAVYEFFRNDKLDARDFFSPDKAPLRLNIFEGSWGGPILKEKTFFFVTYEGNRRRNGLTFADSDVPHPPEINGDFSARRDLRLTDPLTRQPFPGNTIPASRIDPIGQTFARYYPAPNRADNDITRAPVDNFVTNVSDSQTGNPVIGKVDHAFGPNDRLSGRYSLVGGPSRTAAVFPNEFADSRAAITSSVITSVQANWVHNFTPSLFQELRYMYGTRRFNTRAAGTGSGKNREAGLAGVNPDAFATIAVTGLTRMGGSPHARATRPITNHQIIDNLTWIRNKHQLKAGFEFRYSQLLEDFDQSTGGSFTFSERATGSGLASLLLGWTTSAALVDTDPLDVRGDYWATYLQDDWKVTPKLTLNLGLRWEMDTPRWVRENRQSGFDPRATNPVSGTPGVVTFAGMDGQSKYAHNFNKNNVGPRIGFAYRTVGGLVLRGGYGVSYNGAYNGTVAFVQYQGFALSGSFNSPDGGLTPAFVFRNGMPAVTREALGPGFGSVPVGASPRTAPDFFAPDQVNGYAQQWNFTVQKQLAGAMLLEAGYLANVAHKLGGPNVDLNMVPLVNGRGPARQNQQQRPFPQFNSVTQLSPPWGNSSYHALSVKAEKRYSHGLNFLTHYTWSKFLDDVEANNELGGSAGNGYTHIELRRLDKSLAGANLRHRMIASAVYELPLGHNRRWNITNAALNQIAGGWGLGFIAELRVGPTYGANEQTNLTNTFSHAQRPNLVRDPTLDSNRPRAESLSRYFDTSAFEAPGAGVFGNAPRTMCCGPGLIGIDLSANKKWLVAERYGIQFRADFFNLPNRPSFDLPGLLRGRADFGRISGILAGSTGRQIQLGLRFEF